MLYWRYRERRSVRGIYGQRASNVTGSESCTTSCPVCRSVDRTFCLLSCILQLMEINVKLELRFELNECWFCEFENNVCIHYSIVFTRATPCIARSFRQRRVCPIVSLSVRLSHAGIVPNRAKECRIVKYTPSDSLMILVSGKVWLVEKFAEQRVTPKGRAKWEWGKYFRLFSTNVSQFLENGAS